MCFRLSLRLVSVLRMATMQQNASRTVCLTKLSFIMTLRRASTWSSDLQSFTISFCIALRSPELALVALQARLNHVRILHPTAPFALLRQMGSCILQSFLLDSLVSHLFCFYVLNNSVLCIMHFTELMMPI